ncbi:cyclic nucleotide-binding domain-containing protein [Marinibacterium sp. SX1]|uniref:cyclic nucleotide-binding domain-containing protein n=1 Tax=Marinibacterium sp. SX1 TaxID=3388424 RepID=UPI003D16E456
MVLVVVTAMLFPLLYLTLELPKRIINDAIGAAVTPIPVLDMEIEQVPFLMILCGGFLLSVLGHGLLKMRINTMKGILSERMLRRFRYLLIHRILRFPQPYFERVSQGELVSMITAESEPMGGLMGDMLSQPVLQAGQMATILFFLFAQSFWFGVAAVALIPLQAWLIPKLQRQINRLNKKRIVQVRALAGEIGESASGASAIRTHGGWRHRMAMITDRLGRLYEIRFEIYQKKFFMKFLNNFIGQLTPFFFFSIGGYLVIQGSVTIGALVAALAAYKDLSSPWKELLAYYNQTQDMAVRWEILIERFDPPGMIDEALFEGEPETLPRLNGDITLDHVTIRDADGNAVLDDIDVTMPGGAVIAIAAPSAEDRRALSELLVREVTPSAGAVAIGGTALQALHQSVIAGRVGRVSSRPVLFQGTFGDNVMMPLRPFPREGSFDEAFAAESLKAGNSPDPFAADWLLPARAGVEDEAALRAWWGQLIEGMGSGTALFRRGLEQRFDEAAHPDLARKLVEIRPAIQEAVRAAGLRRHAYFFLPELYNQALPVAENLLFATPRRPVTREALAEQGEFLAQLRALGLDKPLVALTCDVLEMLRQIFGLDGTDHPLFRRLGLDPATYEATLELVDREGHGRAEDLSPDDLALLLTVPFGIPAEQIGPAFPEAVKERILEIRNTHAATLQQSLSGLFAPLDPDRFAPGVTVLENALFGKISEASGAKADELRKVVTDTLIELGLKGDIMQLILDVPVALAGQGLPAYFAEPLSFSRATIKRPDLLILEQAFASFDAETQQAIFRNLRVLLPDSTLVYVNDKFDDPEAFDVFYEIRQGRLISDAARDETETDSAASADLSRKLRALEQTALFSGLNRKQLRLLAFGARWFEAEAGEVIFRKGDEPTDGAYMVIEGEAGLYLPQDDGADRLITQVGPGTLVGELGLIRKVPRALSMQAETGLVCLRIGEEEFLAVVENDAATAFKLLQVVAGYVSS